MEVSYWFILLFGFAWALGPVTQALFLFAPRLHHKIGLTEDSALKPEFRWFFLDEKAIAIADMTSLVSGGLFIWLALSGEQTALIFGLYTSACYVYISILAVSRWQLFGQNQLSPLSARQMPFYIAYMALFLVFGLYGLFYLWSLAQP